MRPIIFFGRNVNVLKRPSINVVPKPAIFFEGERTCQKSVTVFHTSSQNASHFSPIAERPSKRPLISPAPPDVKSSIRSDQNCGSVIMPKATLISRHTSLPHSTKLWITLESHLSIAINASYKYFGMFLTKAAVALPILYSARGNSVNIKMMTAFMPSVRSPNAPLNISQRAFGMFVNILRT